MQNLKDKLNAKIPLSKVYKSTSKIDSDEHITYFLISSDGGSLLQLTGKNAGEVFTTQYDGKYKFNAGSYRIWQNNNLKEEFPFIKQLKYSTLLKYWNFKNNKIIKQIQKNKEEKVKTQNKKQEKNKKENSMVDEFFK